MKVRGAYNCLLRQVDQIISSTVASWSEEPFRNVSLVCRLKSQSKARSDFRLSEVGSHGVAGISQAAARGDASHREGSNPAIECPQAGWTQAEVCFCAYVSREFHNKIPHAIPRNNTLAKTMELMIPKACSG